MVARAEPFLVAGLSEWVLLSQSWPGTLGRLPWGRWESQAGATLLVHGLDFYSPCDREAQLHFRGRLRGPGVWSRDVKMAVVEIWGLKLKAWQVKVGLSGHQLDHGSS